MAVWLKSMFVDGWLVSEVCVWYWVIWMYIVANPNALRINQGTFCYGRYMMISLVFVEKLGRSFEPV